MNPTDMKHHLTGQHTHRRSEQPSAERMSNALHAARDGARDNALVEMLWAENQSLRQQLYEREQAIESYTQLYDRSPFGHLSLDRMGRVVDLNATAVAMLGEERGAVIGKPFVRYVTPESRNRFYVHLHACKMGTRAAIGLRLKSAASAPSREVELVSARDPQRPGQALFQTVMIDRGQHVDGGLAFKRGAEDLSRAVRFLEAQQYELEARNQRLVETQRLLQESRDRYAQLYEFAPIGYLSLDSGGCIRVLNLTAAVTLGAERMQLVGRPLAEFLDEPDLLRFQAHLEACRAGAPQVKTELRLKSVGGAREIELISVRTPEDETEGVLLRSAMTDITERKRAAEALRESESKLRWLIDNMPAVLWIQDEHGNLRYVSANVARVLGYAEHELRAGGPQFWLDNIHPDDRDRVQASYARLFAGGQASGPAAYDIEYRRHGRDGSWIWIIDRGMSVSEENGVRYATGMFWDTSRRKRMQEQLRESEERFRQLAENINDVFFLTDLDGGRLHYVSPTVQKIWGFSADRLLQDPASWQELVHEADRGRVRRAVRARRPGVPYDIEFRIRRPDGAVRWIRMRGFPIHDAAGRPYRVAGIAADVTVRKEAAQSLQRSHQSMRELALHLESVREEERKRIAREIHDELGALLLAIKMDAEACRKRQAPADDGGSAMMHELIGRVDAAIDSVRRIATDLRPSILDNLGVLAAVEWEAQDVERRTGIKCIVETEPDTEDLDVAPEPATAIFRIVQEALSNVVRHSGATCVKIALREEAGNVKLQITDNGRGINLEDRPDSRRWGLVGMAERVHAFNGKFGVNSVAPHGTVITATIPARSPARRREARW